VTEFARANLISAEQAKTGPLVSWVRSGPALLRERLDEWITGSRNYLLGYEGTVVHSWSKRIRCTQYNSNEPAIGCH
jgi:hypothetical protein